MESTFTLHTFGITVSSVWFQRQKYNQYYFINGAIYIFSSKNIVKYRSRFSNKNIKYIMPQLNSIDIDNDNDWIIAESLLKYYEL